MRNVRWVSPWILGTWILLAPALSAANPHSLLGEVTAVGRAMDRTLVEGDIEANLAFYAENAVVLPNNGPKLEGKDAIRRKLESDRAAGLKFTSFEGQAEEAWECCGLVYVVGRYALSFTLPGSEQPASDRGKFLSIWQRTEQGRLVILYDIWNTDAPPGS